MPTTTEPPTVTQPAGTSAQGPAEGKGQTGSGLRASGGGTRLSGSRCTTTTVTENRLCSLPSVGSMPPQSMKLGVPIFCLIQAVQWQWG